MRFHGTLDCACRTQNWNDGAGCCHLFLFALFLPNLLFLLLRSNFLSWRGAINSERIFRSFVSSIARSLSVAREFGMKHAPHYLIFVVISLSSSTMV